MILCSRETNIVEIKTWQEIAIEAFFSTTGLVVRTDNLDKIKIPVDHQDSFCREVARKTGLLLGGAQRQEVLSA